MIRELENLFSWVIGKGIKGYLLCDTTSHDFLVSRNVIFYKNVFPFSELSSNKLASTNPYISGYNVDLDFFSGSSLTNK